MVEWVLVVWLYVGGELAPGFEVGTYFTEGACVAAMETVAFERAEVEFVAICVERSK